MQWYLDKYGDKSADRKDTFNMVFDMIAPSPIIVETGCVRMEEDYGAGYSTVIFADYVATHGGKLITVDLSVDNIQTAKKLTKKWSKYIEYVQGDSVEFLKNFGATHPNQFIDLLYLDSFDYPEAGGDPFPCQNHQRKELAQVWKYVKQGGLILLDDNLIGEGGKTRITKEVLAHKGAKCLSDGGQQALYRK